MSSPEAIPAKISAAAPGLFSMNSAACCSADSTALHSSGLPSRNRVVAASTAPLCVPAMSNESMTRLIAGSASSRSTYGVREKCAVISPLPAISEAAALSSGIAIVILASFWWFSMPHSCAAAMSSITAGPESLSAGTAMRSPGPKSRIVPIAGLRVTST